MFLEPFLLSGPFRVILIFILMLILYRVAARKVPGQTALNFLIPSITLIFSSTVIGGFLLLIIKAYDLFVILSIVLGMVIFIFMNINFNRSLKDQLQKIYTRSILYVVIKLEKREKFIDRDNWKKPKFRNHSRDLSGFNKNWQVFIGLSLPVITYLSRSSLYNFDTSTLSFNWYQKLELVKNISVSNLFFNQGEMMGDFLLINLYSKITNISEAVALQSSGLLESGLLSIVIYWVMHKISGKQAPGIFAGLSFSLLYAFLPISLDLLAEHKSIFSALIISLPTMLFSIYPQTFRFRRKTATLILVILFLAILLIDLFVGLIVMFPFLLIVFLFRFWRKKRQMLLVLTSYGLAVLAIGLLYSIAAWWHQEDLNAFIRSNLFSYNAYTYNPKLILPLKELIGYYQVAGVIFLAVTGLKFIKRPKKNMLSIIFLVFINLLFATYHFEAVFIDLDMLNEVLCIFIPIFFGLILNSVIELFSSIKVPGRTAANLQIGSGIIVIIALLVHTFPKEASLRSDGLSPEADVFKAYANIQNKHLPYSYAVVNSVQNSSFSKDSHYFYNYNYFNEKYITRDRSFHLFKDDRNYLLANPGVILPQTLFIFVYEGAIEKHRRGSIDMEQQHTALKRIELLEKRGREVRLYYQGDNLKVYQIINKAGESNIQELLF